MSSRNHPDIPDDALLESARRILTTTSNTFLNQNWRITMTKAKAMENAKAMKVAAKKLEPVPKHVPKASPGTPLAASPEGQTVADSAQLSEAEMQAIHSGRRATDPVVVVPAQVLLKGQETNSQGTDTVVESGFSIFNQRAGAQHMTEASTLPDLKASEAQAAKVKATQEAIAAKAAKKAETEAKKAAQVAELAAKKAEREAKSAESKAAREAKAAELKAAGKGYVGSMLSLADRVKQGVYVKGMTGQLRSSDELAVALDAVPPANVILLGLAALKLEANPYSHLNQGQQSMNLRNKMRGAIKAGTLTLDEVKTIRDRDNLATAEAEVAAKKEAAAARAKKAEEAKAAKAEAKKSVEAKASANTAGKATISDAAAQAPVEQAIAQREPISEQATQVKSVKPKKAAEKV